MRRSDRPCRAPGRAPSQGRVGQHHPGQAIAPEQGRQLALHRLGRLVRLRPQPQRMAAVVIQHRQRMATPPVQREMAFVAGVPTAPAPWGGEVHLPKLVRRRALEPDEGLVAQALSRVDPAMTMQDRRHSRGRRHPRQPQILRPTRDLAPTPQIGWAQAGYAARTSKTRASITAAVRPGLRRGWRLPSARPASPNAACRRSRRWPVSRLIPNRRHSSDTPTAPLDARRTSSRR